jgi:protein SCO1/2
MISLPSTSTRSNLYGIVAITGAILFFNMLQSCESSYAGVREVNFPKAVFLSQSGDRITPVSWKARTTIAAFFFTTCPTICPKMVKQMKRVQTLIEGSSQYRILFFTIDPSHDLPDRLQAYAHRNGIMEKYWWLLQGSDETISKLAAFYSVRAGRDKNDASQFIHDGSFLLMTQSGEVETYNGIDSISVDQLLRRIKNTL